MRVPENWDRPTGGRGGASSGGGASYYPPLRKPAPAEPEGSCSSLPEGSNGSSQRRSSSRDPPRPLWRRDDADSSSVFGKANNGSSFGANGTGFGGFGANGSFGASTFSGSTGGSASSSIYGSGSNGSIAGSTSMFAGNSSSSSSTNKPGAATTTTMFGSSAGNMFGSAGASKESGTFGSNGSVTYAAGGSNGTPSYIGNGGSGQNGTSYFGGTGANPPNGSSLGTTNGQSGSSLFASTGINGNANSYGGFSSQNGNSNVNGNRNSNSNSLFAGTATSSSSIFDAGGAAGRPAPTAQSTSSFAAREAATTAPSSALGAAATPNPTPNRWSTSSFAGGTAAKAAEDDAPLPMVQASPGEVDVRGSGQVPGPWLKWEDVCFAARLKAPLTSAGFPCPTVIQQHAWPILSSGRDLIGIAKTGSGKTLAFLLPGFSKLTSSTGYDPRGPPAILVLAPTRELAVQIEQQAKQFGGPAGMRAACLYGGAPKGPQLAELRQRPQVLVATPGRLNDLLDPPAGLSQAVDVKAVGLLVLDEADRMLDMGFEPQIRKIIAALPKDRQTAMFTATWPVVVRRLASDFLRDPIEVRVGEVDDLRVNPDVEQRVVFCMDALDKERRLGELLREAGADQAIIFVNTKRMCESVAFRVDNSVSIHGDKDQRERDVALNLFKSGTRRALVATDVAARGLDIKSVKLVINFDPPNRDEDYVHRVGRTGRAGKKGTAITLLTNEDATAARFIADLLRKGKIPVPEELERKLASGELRSGGGRDRGRGPSRMSSGAFGMGGSASRARSVGVLGGRDPFGADDFDFGFDRGARAPRNDFMNVCATDCPTW